MALFFGQKPEKKKPQLSAAEEESKKRAAPWVEKYRPQKVDDVVYQTETVQSLKQTLADPASLPHMLFHGPPGTGKTTVILAMCKELFGPEYIKNRVKELNASDDRGIDVVRQKLKKFAQVAVTSKPNQTQNGKFYPVPPYKIIILDEADALLPDAQAALRRMMEDFSNVTRFCLICNYLSRIIDPIASRCVKFRFKPLAAPFLRQRVQFVAESEGLKISEKSLDSLARVSGGDLRLAITYLQGAATLYENDLSSVDFSDVAGCVPIPDVQAYLETLCSGNLDHILQHTKAITLDGHSATQILHQLHDEIAGANETAINSVSKSQIALLMSQTEKRLHDGADEYLQLLAFAMAVMPLLNRTVRGS